MVPRSFPNTPTGSPFSQGLGFELVKLLFGLLVLSSLAYFFRHGGNFTKSLPERSQILDANQGSQIRMELCGLPSDDGRAVVVEMVYSEEKRRWMELANDRFSRLCPNIQVKLTAMPDIAAALAILSNQVQPTVWAPTDELFLQYLAHRWKQRPDPLPFQLAAQTSLVQSPLVLLFFQDRVRVLSAILREKHDEPGLWVRGICPLIPREPELTDIPLEKMVPGTWGDFSAPLFVAKKPRKRVTPDARLLGKGQLPPWEEIEKWGQVQIGHAQPMHDSAGLAALYLMAFDYVLPPKEKAALEIAERTGPDYEKAFADKKDALQKWLRRCEAGLAPAPKTAQYLTTIMGKTGPSLYDGVVTYEHLALPLLEKFDKNAGALPSLTIVYPQPMLIARHPAVLFNRVPEQQEAARRWLRFLVSQEMQEKAIEAGFRPSRSGITVGTHNVEQNRFLRLRRYGVLLEPHLLEAPRAGGRLVQELIALWGEATGRN